MPRAFDMATDYRAGVEQVHRTFADERYWRARLAGSGADEATLDRLDVGADGSVEVVTTEVLRSDRLPGLVTQFHRGDLAITREESWSALTESQATAEVTGSIAGAPVDLAGTAELTGSESLARLAFRASVEVRVPLVGGKLEKFIANQLSLLLISEQQFTTGWIAERR
jgi:hypothetical protein